MREAEVHNHATTVVQGVFQYQFGQLSAVVLGTYTGIRPSFFENSDANSGPCFETFNYFAAANLLPGH